MSTRMQRDAEWRDIEQVIALEVTDPKGVAIILGKLRSLVTAERFAIDAAPDVAAVRGPLQAEALRWVASLLSGELQRAVNEVADGVERGEPLPPRA